MQSTPERLVYRQCRVLKPVTSVEFQSIRFFPLGKQNELIVTSTVSFPTDQRWNRTVWKSRKYADISLTKKMIESVCQATRDSHSPGRQTLSLQVSPRAILSTKDESGLLYKRAITIIYNNIVQIHTGAASWSFLVFSK